MNQTDVYYRALLGYREEVSANRACVRDTRLYAEAAGHGRITVKRALCTVDEAWIHAIEEGLVHIEKAIKEERQFIYSNGEVIPIEKVKNISKDSVQHLARHSELITREPEGEDIIPDSLYTVERLSDYAVYENRFLYMLLCYLRDFVTLRYQSILELTNRYEGVLSVEREIKSLNRQINLSIELDEIRRDDPYLREHNPVRSLIERMDLILKTILAFLATPLMESAGKVAMLKPPITKTNILKMDNHFKGAVALYDYIIAYEGPGYTVEETEVKLDPFADALAEDMAEAERLISFLTYRYGLNLSDDLKVAYEREEIRRKEEELKQRTEQMATIRRRLAAEGQPPEAYILYLEKQVRALQNEVDRVPSILAELEENEIRVRDLSDQLELLTLRYSSLEEAYRAAELAHAEEMRTTVANYEAQLAELRETHAAELVSLAEQHESEMNAQREEYEERIGSIRGEYEERISSICGEYEERIGSISGEYEERISTMQESYETEIQTQRTEHEASVSAMRESYEARINALREDHVAETTDLHAFLATAKEEYELKTLENEEMTEENRHLRAQILGLRSGKNNISASEFEEMTKEENFDELERELEAFIRFYEEQWKRTKRAIRKDLLNPKSIKRQSKMK